MSSNNDLATTMVRSHNIGNVSSVAVVENKQHKNPKSQT